MALKGEKVHSHDKMVVGENIHFLSLVCLYFALKGAHPLLHLPPLPTRSHPQVKKSCIGYCICTYRYISQKGCGVAQGFHPQILLTLPYYFSTESGIRFTPSFLKKKQYLIHQHLKSKAMSVLTNQRPFKHHRLPSGRIHSQSAGKRSCIYVTLHSSVCGLTCQGFTRNHGF